MGPKKKKGGKGKEVEEKVEESEYDTMDLEMLREVVPMLRQQLDKSMLDRNYVQLERVRSFTNYFEFNIFLSSYCLLSYSSFFLFIMCYFL